MSNSRGGQEVLVAMFQTQVEADASVPGSNPNQDYNIDHSELEITCHYSNSRAPGDLWSLIVLVSRLKLQTGP